MFQFLVRQKYTLTSSSVSVCLDYVSLYCDFGICMLLIDVVETNRGLTMGKKQRLLSFFMLVFAAVASQALASTNYRDDSFDIFRADINSDGAEDIVFVPVDKMLLIAGEVNTPVIYQDGGQFALLYQDGSYSTVVTDFSFDPEGLNTVSEYTIEVSDINNDSQNDISLIPDSGAVVVVYGSNSSDTPATVYSSSHYAGFENDSETTYSTISTNSGDALLVSHNDVTFLVDKEGNPYNPTQQIKTTTAFGVFKGHFSVSQGGAAVYRLPLDIVSGPAGIKPRVSVNYYSHAGQGPLGRGWSLSASEVISRCKPVGRATDAPDYDDEDTYCLNGDELVEIDSDLSLYRKRIDDGSLVQKDNNESFSVYLENGISKVFDKTLSTNDSSAIKKWYLGKVTQLGGASYDLSYFMDNEIGEALLTKINYGSHYIAFNYEQRPDRRFGYDHGGAKFARTKRLANIKTYTDNDNTLTYTFHYDYNERIDQSYLVNIQKCGGSLCYEPLAFNWSDPGDSWASEDVYSFTALDCREYIKLGDMNGDGITDAVGYCGNVEATNTDDLIEIVHFEQHEDEVSLLYSVDSTAYGSPNVYTPTKTNTSMSLADLDSDGVTDIGWYNGDAFQSFLSQGSFEPFIGVVNQGAAKDSFLTQLADFNGDGSQDVLQTTSLLSDQFYVLRGNGDGSFNSPSSKPKSDKQTLYSTGDVDGDGKADVIMFHGGEDYIDIKFGGGTTTSINFSESFQYSLEGSSGGIALNEVLLTVADINGDGLSDVIITTKEDQTLRIILSTGRALSSIAYEKSIVWNDDQKPSMTFLDVNGDGRSDHVESGAYSLGKIDGTLSEIVIDDSIPEFSTSNDNHQLTAADMNGDGTVELIRIVRNDDTYDEPLLIRRTNSTRLQIEDFIDASGLGDYVTYLPMTDDWVYKAAQPGWYEEGIGSYISASRNLVWKAGSKEGLNYFKYAGAQYSLDDGFLGFQLYASVYSRDFFDKDSGDEGEEATKSIVSVTYLSQDYRFVGKPYQVHKYVSSSIHPVGAFWDLEIDGEDILTARYDSLVVDEKLFSGFVSPLETCVITSAYCSFMYHTEYSDSEPYSIRRWDSYQIADGVVRPMLRYSNSYQYDPYDRSKLISSKKTRREYDWTGDYNSLRLANSITIVGDASDGWAGSLTSVEGEYVKKTKNTYSYEQEASGVVDNYKNLQATKKVTVESAESPGWFWDLLYQGLSASETSTTTTRYKTNGLLDSTVTEVGTGDELLTSYTYDSIGQVSSVSTETNDGATDQRYEFYSYDLDTGYLLYEQNAEGHTKTYSDHNNFGVPASIELSRISTDDSLSSKFVFDALGRVVEVDQVTGNTLEFSYGSCSGTHLGCQADNNETFSFYTKVVSDSSGESYQYFNQEGRLIKTAEIMLDGQYRVRASEYDIHGRRVHDTNPILLDDFTSSDVGGERSYRYDFLDNIIHADDGAGGQTDTDIVYEGNGNKTKIVTVKISSVSSRETIESYNAFNQLTLVERSNGSFTKYLYDVRGNLVRQWYSAADYDASNPERNGGTDDMYVIENTFDDRGRLVKEIDPNTGTTLFAYSPYNEIVSVSNPRVLTGEVSQPQIYEYDDIGRVTKASNDSGTSCYFYDDENYGTSIGQLTELRFYQDKSAECSNDIEDDGYYHRQEMHFNSNGLVQYLDEETNGVYFGSEFTYNSIGQLTDRYWAHGALHTSYQYDSSSGLLVKIEDSSGLTYWELDSINSLGFAETTQLAGGMLEVNRQYETATGRMRSMSATQAGVSTLISQHYYYSENGLQTRLVDDATDSWAGYSETYGYGDAAKRQLTSVAYEYDDLQTAGTFTYSYDSLGNIREANGKKYTYDEAQPHRLLTALDSEKVYSYYTGGLVKNDGSRTLTYEHNHLPVQITQGDHSARYVYAADDSRLYRQDSESIGSSEVSEITKQTWFFSGMLYSRENGSTIGEKTFYVADGVEVTIQDESTSQELQLSVTNNLGSVVFIADGGGNLKQRLRYDPFGKVQIVQTGNLASASRQLWKGTSDIGSDEYFVSLFGFTGHEHLYEFDLIHMNGRVYDPTIGRFLQPDVIIQAPSQILSYNRYSYVWNNPLGYTDPTGYAVTGATNAYEYTTTDENGDTLHHIDFTFDEVGGDSTGAPSEGDSASPADNSDSSSEPSDNNFDIPDDATIGFNDEFVGVEEVDGGSDDPDSDGGDSGRYSSLGSGGGSGGSLNWGSVMTGVHTALDVAGFFPGLGAFADAANAVVYLAEGKRGMAAVSVMAALPFIGDAIAAGRVTNKTVGRWMSPDELSKMQKTGKAQESYSGTTHVADPANPEAFIKQTKVGNVYVEFDVPASSLKKTNEGWAQIVGPNSATGRLAARKGNPVPEMPDAENITHKATKIR